MRGTWNVELGFSFCSDFGLRFSEFNQVSSPQREFDEFAFPRSVAEMQRVLVRGRCHFLP
jgi:hypothetical protein